MSSGGLLGRSVTATPALWAVLGSFGASAPVATAAEPSPCFDVEAGFDRPLHEPIAYLGSEDTSLHGDRPDGTHWAATRAVLDLPARVLLEKLRDHRNVKDMSRTVLTARRFEHPDYLELCHVDVDVTVKALFVKLHLRWTEEWAYRLLAGSPERPELVVANYQKIAGTNHIRHQCGSYVIRRIDDDRSDLFMYEEIRARRRSSEDTRDMHRGILRNIREDLWPLETAPDGEPALHVLTTAQ
jgi:hypothetical protein